MTKSPITTHSINKKGRPPKEKPLNFQEMCSIIELGSKNGVQSISIGDFCVMYQASSERFSPEIQESGPTLFKEQFYEEKEEMQKGSVTIDDEINAKEIEIANMALENPLEYERMIANGEFVD